MTFVVDASVVCKSVFRQAGHEVARQLFATDEAAIAPELIIAEVCYAAWRLTVSGEINPAHASTAITSMRDVIDDFIPLNGLAERALVIARSLGHPAYDCFYIALAEQERIRFVTCDKRLLGAVARTEWAKLVQALE